MFNLLYFIFQISWWKQNQENPRKSLRENDISRDNVRKRMNHKLESTISLAGCVHICIKFTH